VEFVCEGVDDWTEEVEGGVVVEDDVEVTFEAVDFGIGIDLAEARMELVELDDDD